uniref:ShKT domain-containing protein n=1 Tax=Panagrolaimus davidi TaxID=227884 RepID=A0A914PXY0_9BILA
MFSSFLLFLLILSSFSIFSVAAYESCYGYYYTNCPSTCNIDDCIKPTVLNCKDFTKSRHPKVCKCENIKQANCPNYCEPRECLGSCSNYDQYNDCPSSCLSSECRPCSYYDQDNCPSFCHDILCSGNHLAWYWYLYIPPERMDMLRELGKDIPIVIMLPAFIYICVACRRYYGSRTHYGTVVTYQPAPANQESVAPTQPIVVIQPQPQKPQAKASQKTDS